jgi:hypothetical protein
LVVRIVGKSFAICDSKISVVDWRREYYAGSPNTPIYNVSAPRDPLPGEVTQFQAISAKQQSGSWP